jgi:hypothetical protein
MGTSAWAHAPSTMVVLSRGALLMGACCGLATCAKGSSPLMVSAHAATNGGIATPPLDAGAPGDERMTVHFYDVGQALAALVRLPLTPCPRLLIVGYARWRAVFRRDPTC